MGEKIRTNTTTSVRRGGAVIVRRILPSALRLSRYRVVPRPCVCVCVGTIRMMLERYEYTLPPPSRLPPEEWSKGYNW